MLFLAGADDQTIVTQSADCECVPLPCACFPRLCKINGHLCVGECISRCTLDRSVR